MFNWKKKRCTLCTTKLEPDNATIRMETSEGVHEIDVCDQCADFFERSAEILLKRKPSDEEYDGDDE